MGFWSRFKTLMKSNLNDLISKAEDPEKMLSQVLVDMKQQLVEAKKHVAGAIADEKRLKKQYQDEAAKVEDWESKAMMAVRAGDDDLARQALARKSEHDESATTLKAQWEAQSQSVENLKDSLRALNAKIEEAKRKKNILIARKKRAEAQKAIHETMAGINDTSAFETFDRMAQQINLLEAEAEAKSEVAGELTGDTLERKFAKLESGSGGDKQLLALKEKMGLLEAPKEQKELPEAEKEADPALDAELEALKAKLASTDE